MNIDRIGPVVGMDGLIKHPNRPALDYKQANTFYMAEFTYLIKSSSYKKTAEACPKIAFTWCGQFFSVLIYFFWYNIYSLQQKYLSAYAEDHGLCPWMNADSVAK